MEYIGLDFTEEELMHYGRKGMKWGEHIFGKVKAAKTARKRKKNLEKARAAKAEAKKRAEEEAKKEENLKTRKEEILKSRSARELYKNANMFTTQELDSAYKRLELEKKIKDIAPKEVSKGQAFVNKFEQITGNLDKLTKGATSLYKNTAKLYDTFSSQGKDNPWEAIKQREERLRNKQAEDAKKKAAENKQARAEKKEAKQQKKEMKDAMKTYKEFEKEDSKLKEYEIFTGKVEGKGTSTSQYKDNGKSWVGSKDFDYEIDFSTPSNSSASTAARIESGANYVAGLLEKMGD